MLGWLAGHYAEIVGTLALVVTATNLAISVRRMRREARSVVSIAPGEDRVAHRPELTGGLPQPGETGTTPSVHAEQNAT